MKLYKVTAKGGKSCHGGEYTWVAGEWSPIIEDIELCMSGYHACRKQDLVGWLDDEIWEFEYKGDLIKGSDKVVVQQGRVIRKLDTWNERTKWLFSADCAEHVLHIWEAKYPDDDRPRKEIEAKRSYANNEITRGQLDRELYTAGYAARSAARSVSRSAAMHAARYAAWSAGRSAVGYAERDWQTKRLFEYLNGEIT